jgi:hypothetical protein
VPPADHSKMIRDVRSRLASGEYTVDADAVARAMLTRARALHVARHGAGCSEVLVAADRIEIRRVAAGESEPLPVQRTA